jgi:hypothetical protein
MALARLQPLATVLGETYRVQAAGNDEPIPFHRVGDAGRVGLDRAQVAEWTPIAVAERRSPHRVYA